MKLDERRETKDERVCHERSEGSKTILSEVCEFIVDCPHSTANDEGIGFPLVRTPNVGKGRLVYNDMHRVSEDVYNQRNFRAVPQEDDLIFAREAPAGNVALIRKGEKVCLGQRTVLLRPNKQKVDPSFLTYYLLAPKQQYGLTGTANGATVAHVNMPTIRNLAIELPDIKVQRKLGGILSAYDNLIENNQKQIKLLEEAAQRLYKQWFIDLRYPGHETTKIVNGLPEGWRKEKLVDLASVQFGYAFDGSLFNSNGNGTPIVRIRNIPDGFTNDYTTENAPEEYIINNGDIVVGMDGEFHINSWCGDKSYLVQRSCCFRPHNPKIKGWLLWAIHDPIKFFEKTVVGATVAHLGKKHIDTIELLTGPEKLYKPFQSLFCKRQTLLNQNRKLSESRDRLLPKLMNGELEV
ncbi:restriction endonuclease subunit S [Hallerella succinigenes]|uniref:Type I restriction enzyme S subunit n=1 Tax=Hallerella succinigenes TaxID=1896222 RepID=A0A2M9A7W5_9BACT|nr:restriction endonuclease subunit S [Hallerella succinigenes]PJJ41816.1 type I restriction enzyme S subunit [Hallerella succinigenes]